MWNCQFCVAVIYLHECECIQQFCVSRSDVVAFYWQEQLSLDGVGVCQFCVMNPGVAAVYMHDVVHVLFQFWTPSVYVHLMTLATLVFVYMRLLYFLALTVGFALETENIKNVNE